MEINQISSALIKKKSTFAKKLNEFSNWATNKCEMNGSSNKFIKNMISQVLKELHIPSTKHVTIMNLLYKNDFDASFLVNQVWSYSKNIFDIVNKDSNIITNTVENYHNGLTKCGIKMSAFNMQQKVGICVFVQFILSCGRTELEGFGISSNLIEKRKKNIIKAAKELKMKKQKLEVEKLQKEKLEKEKLEKMKKLEVIEIPDSWEDL